MIERALIINLARKFDIDEYSVLREYLQLLFLKDFYQLPERTNVYFKGGTAIHFLLHSFRFSEDLDFTAAVAKKEVKQLFGETVAKMHLEAPGLESEPLLDKSFSTAYRLKFPTELSIRPLFIRIEISFREKTLTRKVSVIETEFPIVPYPMIVHHDLEEILAEKIRALFTRRQSRDIFDLWFLLSKGVTLNKDFIEKKMRYYGKDFDPRALKKLVEEISTQSLKDDLEKFLPRSHRKMINELKTMLLSKL